MRRLVDTLPPWIDPWMFAQKRQQSEGEIPMANLRELPQWAGERESSLHAAIKGFQDEDQQVHLSGHWHIELSMRCQRCLEAMPIALAQSFDYVVIAKPEEEDALCGGFESLLCESRRFDLHWFLEEEVLLSMPMIAKHESCIAPALGRVDISQHNRQYPFAELKAIVKANKEH